MAIDVQAPPRTSTRRASLEPVLRRLHFLSGFLAAPIVVSLALTGILFAWNPQIEKAIYGDQLTAVSDAPARPLADQVRAAQAVKPDWTVASVTPAAPGVFGGRQTTAVQFIPPVAGAAPAHGPSPEAVSVYVDPGSAAVLGEIREAERPGEWLRNVHSSWRLGDNVAPLTELAASWLLISLVTGLYLRWPVLRKKLGAAFIPRLRTPGWTRAQAFHTTLGLWLIVPLLGLVATGLTWTTFAGSRTDTVTAALGGAAPAVATELPGQDPPGAPPAEPAAGHEGHPGHGGGSAGARAAPSFPATDVATQIDRVAQASTAAGVTGLMTYTPPKTVEAGWKVEKRDQKFPNDPVNLAVDGRDGAVLDRLDWSERPLVARATTMGIAFHQAELFGLGTQVYMTVLALGVIVLIVAGYRMWWLRRASGGFAKAMGGVPPKAGPLWRTVPMPLLVLFAGLIYLMPTLGISFLVYLVLERLVRTLRRPKAAARA